MRSLLPVLASALLLASAMLTLAQGGGQFCLRAFEDRNGNGSLEPGEPLLTAGVSAELRDSAGLVVASGLLDSSPMAAQGVICFQFLQSGEYTLVVSSAARAATGDASFTRRIDEGALPILVDYGARQLPVAAPSAPARATTDLAQLLPRIGLSLLGALLVMAGMFVTGALIWFFALRRRGPKHATPARPQAERRRERLRERG